MGIYNGLEIEASITNWDGIITAKIIFNVHIEACPISSFLADPSTLGTFTTTIGDPSTTFGSYNFIQTNACGYTFSQSLSGDPLPAMITHSTTD